MLVTRIMNKQFYKFKLVDYLKQIKLNRIETLAIILYKYQ